VTTGSFQETEFHRRLSGDESEAITVASRPKPDRRSRSGFRAAFRLNAVVSLSQKLEAAAGASLLYAFGTLIGNADMHNGNLSFIGEHGRPYQLAPAYDMLPMGFAPRSGGALPDEFPSARIHSGVEPETWRQALVLAEEFIRAMTSDSRFSENWVPCRDALVRHIEEARVKIGCLG